MEELEALIEIASHVHYVEVRGEDPIADLHQRLSVVPGFRGMTSKDGKMYATFLKEPSEKDVAELHRLAGLSPAKV